MTAKLSPSPLTGSQKEEHYLNAQTFMQGYTTQSLIQNDNIKTTWINGSDCFWYTRAYKIKSGEAGSIGKEYRIVDAKNLSNSLAFDCSTLAKALECAFPI